MKIKIIDYKTIHKTRYKKVDGHLVGDFLGVDYRIGQGWFVTHLPSGYLVTYAAFLTLDDAKHFAEIMQRIFGDALAHPTPSVLKDNLDSKEAIAFYGLRLRLESLNRPITVEDTNEYLTGLVRTDQSQRVRVGGKSLASAGLS